MKVTYESEAKVTFSFDHDESATLDDLKAMLESLPKAWKNVHISFLDIYNKPSLVSFWIDGSGLHGQGQ